MRAVILAVLSTSLALAPAPAQEPAFRAEVHLVTVGFSVRDSSGRLVSTLAQDDFEILEDGVPQKISFFAHSADVPLDLGLAVDFSGSQDNFVKPHHKDLATFLKDVLASRDRVFLVCFGNHVRVAQDFTAQSEDVISALHRFEKEGGGGLFEFASQERRTLGTAFYDAIFYSIDQRLAKSDGSRKALIVFSDGEDNSSGHHMLEAIEAAQTNDVTLYPIRYTEKLKGGPIARNRYGKEVMARIAKETGGLDFDARGKNLAESFAKIGEELHSSYRLAYHSSNPVADGSFHKVLVRAKAPGYVIRAKTGYYAR
ncbi:MAG TPA: VWA domain-containing protein [Bryobacteraceae bacterium]|nr:VWA domain-containing protein [Bryobacteraceae bacterium]